MQYSSPLMCVRARAHAEGGGGGGRPGCGRRQPLQPAPTHPPVRPQLQLLHDVLQRDELPHIDGHRVLELFRSWVCKGGAPARAAAARRHSARHTAAARTTQAPLTQVDHVHRAVNGVAVLLDGLTVCGLRGRGRGGAASVSALPAARPAAAATSAPASTAAAAAHLAAPRRPDDQLGKTHRGGLALQVGGACPRVRWCPRAEHTHHSPSLNVQERGRSHARGHAHARVRCAATRALAHAATGQGHRFLPAAQAKLQFTLNLGTEQRGESRRRSKRAGGGTEEWGSQRSGERAGFIRRRRGYLGSLVCAPAPPSWPPSHAMLP